MDTNHLFIAELIIFNGVVLAWAAYEWWSVRKSKREAPPPDDPGHAER